MSYLSRGLRVSNCSYFHLKDDKKYNLQVENLCTLSFICYKCAQVMCILLSIYLDLFSFKGLEDIGKECKVSSGYFGVKYRISYLTKHSFEKYTETVIL